MLQDLYVFLKKPKDCQSPNQSIKQKTKSLLLVLGLNIILSVLIVALLGVLHNLGWIDINNHKVVDFLRTSSVLSIYLLAVVFGPLLEEIIFRLFLRFKSNYFLQSITYLFPSSKPYIHEFWKKYFSYIFYLSAIIFALFHLFNFYETSTFIFLLPILVLPQFIGGLLIGYLRVRYNFFLGYLYHAIFNAIIFTISLISLDNQPIKKLDFTSSSYSLKIEEEVGRIKTIKVEDFKNDSIFFKGNTLKGIISILTKKDEKLIDLKNEGLENTRINLAYKNHSKHDLNKDSLILKHLKEVYSFEVNTEIRHQEIYQLYVKDTLKLMKHLSNVQDQIHIQSDNKSVNYKNADLNQIAESLSILFKKHIEYDDGSMQNFNIYLKRRGFSQLKSQLSNYGLDLKKSNKDIEYLILQHEK